ncbi:MAG: lipoyl synthase [Deltaproteobacteria bacterium]|nr:lipoyl synthase [Deltaproteobacteria bacterium]
MSTTPRKPEWLKVRAPGGERYTFIKETLRKFDLHTVCEEARCPNVGECWGEGTATVMILGDVCTRGCKFCAVTTGNPRGAVDLREPEHVGRTIAALELEYVVLTMVDRDDLLDGGARHVADTVRAIKRQSDKTLVETLVGDFAGIMRDVSTVVERGRPDVFAHNVETVARLQQSVRDARCSLERSLAVLAQSKKSAPETYTKSSIMLGLGETLDEVRETMQSLRDVDVDVLTLGQYLRPTPKHHEVVRFVHPDEFAQLREDGLAMGFRYVASGPLVRSSYRASEAFLKGILHREDPTVAADRAELLVDRGESPARRSLNVIA